MVKSMVHHVPDHITYNHLNIHLQLTYLNETNNIEPSNLLFQVYTKPNNLTQKNQGIRNSQRHNILKLNYVYSTS